MEQFFVKFHQFVSVLERRVRNSLHHLLYWFNNSCQKCALVTTWYVIIKVNKSIFFSLLTCVGVKKKWNAKFKPYIFNKIPSKTDSTGNDMNIIENSLYSKFLCTIYTIIRVTRHTSIYSNTHFYTFYCNSCLALPTLSMWPTKQFPFFLPISFTFTNAQLLKFYDCHE